MESHFAVPLGWYSSSFRGLAAAKTGYVLTKSRLAQAQPGEDNSGEHLGESGWVVRLTEKPAVGL
jgi:hypothetical protein